jgi:HlyD family secretion protein
LSHRRDRLSIPFSFNREEENDMKKLMLVVLAVVVAGAVGLAAYYKRANDSAHPNYTSAVVTSGPVIQRVQATGTLQAVTTVAVGSQVSGTISSLHADFNSRVRKGQVLARLEPSLFQTQVEQAEATVRRLQADVERARVEVDDAAAKLRRAEQLSAQQLIPATDLETARTTARQGDAALKSAQAQVAQARAAVNQSRVNLSHTTITAPVDGVVVSRNVDVGQTVAATMQAPTLFVLAEDLTRMQVNASVDEADIGQIQAGQRVTFQVDAYRDEVFSGAVRQVRLDPVVEQNVVSYVTVIDVPNPELKLKPGMTANVTIEVARADGALRVPNAALRFRPTIEELPASGRPQSARASVPQRDVNRAGARRQAVWVLSDTGLRRVPVQTGINDGTTTAVISGDLRDGARVVTGVAAGATTTARSSRSPLLPQRGVRSGSGARPGGGAR